MAPSLTDRYGRSNMKEFVRHVVFGLLPVSYTLICKDRHRQKSHFETRNPPLIQRPGNASNLPRYPLRAPKFYGRYASNDDVK